MASKQPVVGEVGRLTTEVEPCPTNAAAASSSPSTAGMCCKVSHCPQTRKTLAASLSPSRGEETCSTG